MSVDYRRYQLAASIIDLETNSKNRSRLGNREPWGGNNRSLVFKGTKTMTFFGL